MICFTDASYSSNHKLAVIGFKVDDELIQLKITNCIGNAAAEKLTLAWCIEYCINKFGNINLIIYTDHQASLSSIQPRTVELRFIPGHCKKSLMTATQLQFSTVDKACRRLLRLYIKTNY